MKRFLSGMGLAANSRPQKSSHLCSSTRPMGGSMSDEALVPAPALPETPHEAPKGDCRIAFQPAGHVLQILAPPFAADPSAHLAELSNGGACSVASRRPGHLVYRWRLAADAAGHSATRKSARRSGSAHRSNPRARPHGIVGSRRCPPIGDGNGGRSVAGAFPNRLSLRNPLRAYRHPSHPNRR